MLRGRCAMACLCMIIHTAVAFRLPAGTTAGLPGIRTLARALSFLTLVRFCPESESSPPGPDLAKRDLNPRIPA
jgi:hypothetical protein